LPKEDFITCNNYLGMKELVTQMQHKRKQPKICFLHLIPHNDISLERLNSLKKITKEKGLPFKNEDGIAIENLSLINKEFFENIKKKYNCVVAMNDVLAITVLARASTFGYHIPSDFSLTGFDNSPVRNLLPQKVDTISLPVSEIGFKVGEWIHHRIIKKEQSDFQKEITGVYQKGDTI
jgi:DNA-binding LacI/PurR family transcriptional regulator